MNVPHFNSHRSAISAYHNLVEGKPVGQQIPVCNLMAGVQESPKTKIHLYMGCCKGFKIVR